jgi:tRNA threonylcarbamoyladenosine biosynthesis protein TsaE
VADQAHEAAAVVLRADTASAASTRALGSALARALRPGDLVLLVGELGAGKTTLVQGMAAGLGVEEQVTSPTFTLLRPYACGAPGGASNPTALRTLLHADLYRIDRTGELADLALGELVEEDAAAVVEWGEAAGGAWGEAAAVVRIDTDAAGADVRHVTVELAAGGGRPLDELRTVVGGALRQG